MKKIHKIFLQYLLDHQNASDNYFNRFFILKNRIVKWRIIPYRTQTINKAKLDLEKAGLINTSNNRILYITEQGIEFLHQANHNALLSTLERFTGYFNKKLVAITSIITLIISILGLQIPMSINGLLH